MRSTVWFVMGAWLAWSCAAAADEPHGAAGKHENIFKAEFEEHGGGTVEKTLDLSKPADLQLLVDKFKAGEVEAVHKEKQPNLLALQWELGLWTLVIFGLLCLILSKVAWRPALEGLQKREQAILGAIEDAKQARAEADSLRQKFQAEMSQAEARVNAMIEEGRRNAARAAEEETARARGIMQEERERMHRELQLAKDQALQELWNRTAQLATVISTKAIQRQLSLDDHRRLVDESLRELNQRSGDWKQQQVALAGARE